MKWLLNLKTRAKRDIVERVLYNVALFCNYEMEWRLHWSPHHLAAMRKTIYLFQPSSSNSKFFKPARAVTSTKMRKRDKIGNEDFAIQLYGRGCRRPMQKTMTNLCELMAASICHTSASVLSQPNALPSKTSWSDRPMTTRKCTRSGSTGPRILSEWEEILVTCVVYQMEPRIHIARPGQFPITCMAIWYS